MLKTSNHRQEGSASGQESEQERHAAADMQQCSESLQKTEHGHGSFPVSYQMKPVVDEPAEYRSIKKGGIESYAAFGVIYS